MKKEEEEFLELERLSRAACRCRSLSVCVAVAFPLSAPSLILLLLLGEDDVDAPPYEKHPKVFSPLSEYQRCSLKEKGEKL